MMFFEEAMRNLADAFPQSTISIDPSYVRHPAGIFRRVAEESIEFTVTVQPCGEESCVQHIAPTLDAAVEMFVGKTTPEQLDALVADGEGTRR